MIGVPKYFVWRILIFSGPENSFWAPDSQGRLGAVGLRQRVVAHVVQLAPVRPASERAERHLESLFDQETAMEKNISSKPV